MAYIDKDNLINDINEAWERHYSKCNDKLPNDIYRMFINKINKALTADVVKVVRCKDCKYYHKDIYYCDILLCNMKRYDYCSYGDTE